MPSLQLQSGTCLEYDVVGEGAPVVLLPGLGTRRFVWMEVAQTLGERYRVIACDLRGNAGGPAGGRFTIADLAEDVALLLQGLGLDGAVVVGHSQGGFVALELALAHPELVRGMALLSAASYTDEYGRTLLRHWRALAERGDAQLLLDDLFLWNFSPHFCNERTREMRMLKALIRKGALNVEAFIGHTLASETHETRSRLPALRIPTLLVGGDADIVMTLRHNRLLQELMPHSELATLPSVGHHVMAEAPDEVLRLLAAFLDRHVAGRAAAAGGDAGAARGAP